MIKKSMSLTDKLVLGIGYAAAVPCVFILGTSAYRTKQMFDNAALVEPYLTRNKVPIEAEVEEFYGIDIPAVNLSFVDRIEGYRAASMSYDHSQRLVSVSKELAAPFLEKPEGWVFPILHQKTTKGSYIHELGHSYYYSLEERIPAEERGEKGYFADAVISEGVGDYFSVTLGANKPELFHDWPEDIEELEEGYYRQNYYELGRRIVTPILDQLGVEAGIIALHKTNVTDEELLDPQTYQTKVLERKK